MLSASGLEAQSTRENLKRHITALTSDSLLGRESGTIGENRAADYISGIFKEYGLLDLYPRTGQDFSFVTAGDDTIQSRNVLAIIEGYDPKLRNQYIIIGAHYDHLGFNETDVNSISEKQIFRGADNNASGVAALMEIAREINAKSFLFKRTVIIAAFGAGEKMATGSWYFLNRAFTFRDSISLMINLDMVGRSGSANSFQAYTSLYDATLSTLVKETSSMPAMLSPELHSTIGSISDHQNFTTSGIPALLITTGNHRDNRTLRDTEEHIDYTRLEDIVMYTVELSRIASGSEYPLYRTALSDSQQEEVPETGKQNSKSGDRIYTRYEVDKAPAFLNSNEQTFLDRWVYDYVKYPKSAINAGIQGRVMVEFIVEKDGSVSSVRIVKSLDDAIDAETLKVVKASPKWKPGMYKGETVRVKIALPVEFKLRK